MVRNGYIKPSFSQLVNLKILSYEAWHWEVWYMGTNVSEEPLPPPSSGLTLYKAHSVEDVVPTHQSTRRHVPDNNNLLIVHCEGINSTKHNLS